MIIRKPYAFLIKNFKRIHFILVFLMIYLAYETSNILTFFNELISTGTFDRTSFSLPSTYINIYMFITTILVAAISIIIFILMRQKKKPKLLYLVIIGFYLGLVLFFFHIYNTLGIIEISTINPRSLRILRDFTSVICYAQYAIIVIIAIRAFGFNIKKFNFGEDLAELEIDVNDNEEFELTVGIDPEKIGRRIRQGKREFKYFIIENLFVITIIIFFLITAIGVTIFLNTQVYNKIYFQNDTFKANYFVNQINATYFTHLNQRGEKIAPTGKIFVVTSVTFSNRDIYAHKLNLDDINIVTGDDVFSPIITRYQSFRDLGTGYINQSIDAGKASTFIFVFEIDETVNLNKLIFRYTESMRLNATRLEAKYKKVRLRGVARDTLSEAGEAKKGEDLVFTDSSLLNTKLNIKDMQISDLFVYDATICINGICNIYKTNLTLQYTAANRTLMKLSFDYNKDSNTMMTGVNNLADLINSYGFIHYSVNNKKYSAELINRTPSNYNGKDLYFQVPVGIKNANSIELVFRIRDKEFTYKLK